MTASTGALAWKEPEDDGGSPITGYVIEFREASRSTWNSAGTSETLEFTAEKLVEGKEYMFRVAAKNDQGVSDFVEIPEPVVAKNPFGKQLLSLVNLLTQQSFSLT